MNPEELRERVTRTLEESAKPLIAGGDPESKRWRSWATPTPDERLLMDVYRDEPEGADDAVNES